MTIFQHLVPAALFGISSPQSPVQFTFVVHDVQRAIYVQQSGVGFPATLAGYIPLTADGQNGLTQLARSLDANYNSVQTTTGFSASYSGGQVTVNYPTVTVLVNGAVQSGTSGSFTSTSIGSGSYSFGVSYSWGLNQFSIQSATQQVSTNYVELCTIVVDSTAGTATVVGARINGAFMGNLGVAGSSSFQISNGIPVSDANGNMVW